MERISDELEEDIENEENLRLNYSQEELASMCAAFARENLKLIRWLYKYHLKVLREYEDRYMDGKHISFAG